MKAQFIAASALFMGALSQSTIYSGTGFGTYYYDVEDVEACGTTFEYQNLGDVECNQETGLTLDQIDSNYLVAMNNTQLISDPSLYCGKKVVVSVNGQASDLELFIGDGCQRCGTGSADADTWNSEGAPGLDFSLTVLNELSSGSACDDGHIDITWEIVDETLYNFDTNAPGQSTGPVSS
jgi:hypothetical protein